MIKLLFALPLITLALFTNTLVPSVATITFQPDTTLTQVVALLNTQNTWAENNNFTIRPGLQFAYKQGSTSVADLENELWQIQGSFADLDKKTVPQGVADSHFIQNFAQSPSTKLPFSIPPPRS